jgi:hypothetical protein
MLRKLAIHTVTAISWRSSRTRLAEALHRFSLVEADSAWQMLQALNDVEDPVFQAKLFRNAIEEAHHAERFRVLANRYAKVPLSSEGRARQKLYDPSCGLAAFEASHFRGEAKVFADFLAYSRAVGDDETKNMFLEIRGDEGEHQKLALAELVRLTGSPRAARMLLWRVRLKSGWDAWIRLAESIGDTLSSIVLGAIYFVAGPILFGLCRARILKAPVRNRD